MTAARGEAQPAQLVLRATASAPNGLRLDVTPESAGWTYSGLRVLELAAGDSVTVDLGEDEGLVLPLVGGVRVESGGDLVELVGRNDVFDGPSDALYLGRGSSMTLSAPALQASSAQHGPVVRVAVATARAARALPSHLISAGDVRIEVRGSGNMTRRVASYTVDTDVSVDRLLVCEVFTPAGNWSSYPPHKHDVHSHDERVLEEIYYFEVAPAPEEAGGGSGVGYHRVYGAHGNPVDVLEEVRTGDVVLVPHGYHGPSMAAPGYDLYYLNVMAGPADDGRWLATDDPAHAWVRETWPSLVVDPRVAAPPDPSPQPTDAEERS